MKKHFIFQALLLILSIAACTDEKSDEWVLPGGGNVPKKEIEEQPEYNASGIVTDSATKKGIPGVVVSDGINCVETDEDGVYYLPAETGKCRSIFVITPSGYEPAMKDCNFAGYVLRDLKSDKSERYDFELKKRRAPADKFKMLFIADIQINRNGKFYEVGKTFFQGVKDLYSNEALPTYTISLGDCVYSTSGRDAVTESMQEYRSYVALSGIPTFNVIGNHDHFPQAKAPFYEASSGYVSQMGPNNYAVNIGGVHFIMLDSMDWSNDPAADKAMTSGFNEEVLSFLENDLKFVSKDTPVMICLHTNVVRYHNNYGTETLNQDRFFNLLKGYSVNVWYGHEHHNYNYSYTASELSKYGIKSLDAHCVVRSCGSLFMNGRVFSEDGIPWGVVEMTVDGKDVKWRYRSIDYVCPGTSFKADFPDDVLAFGPDISGDSYVYCNPYMHDNLWSTPEWWENGVKKCNMTDMSGTKAADPYVLWSYKNVLKLDYDDDPQYRFHLFRAKPTAGVKSGEVHVKDRFGVEYVREVSF